MIPGPVVFFQRLEERGLGRVHASGSRRDEPVDNGSPWRTEVERVKPNDMTCEYPAW